MRMIKAEVINAPGSKVLDYVQSLLIEAYEIHK